jgi:GDP-mannose 6-dehydrogenase
MRLSVFGLGYVGCVSAACFAREGHEVIGVDISPVKVESINRGESTIVEEGIGDLVAEVVAAGRLRATINVSEAVRNSEISLVCVGTPSRPNGSVDLSYIERVCEQIGSALEPRAEPHLVVIRSTVLPGTVESLAAPALERASGTQRGERFDVCVNPEFLREGTSIKDFHAPPYTLIGADSDAVAERVATLYSSIDAPVFAVPTKVAEMVKYASNAFHAVKVSFANEIGNICKALGVDSHAVMDIFASDTKLNISRAYLKPGFAFGGSCLPKDVRAITYKAKELDVPTPVLSATLETNRHQIERSAAMVFAAGSRRVGILGLSFKEGTDDLRESPMVALAEILIGKGMELTIYDPNVSRGGLLGANKEFIEQQIPHIWSLMRDDLSGVIEGAETLVVGSRAPEFRCPSLRAREGRVIIDLARLFPDCTSDGAGYQGICW